MLEASGTKKAYKGGNVFAENATTLPTIWETKQSGTQFTIKFLKGMEWRNWEDFLKATEENGSMATNEDTLQVEVKVTCMEHRILLPSHAWYILCSVFFFSVEYDNQIYIPYHLYRPALKRPCTQCQETS